MGIDGTMDRSVGIHKLSIESIKRNLRISRKRSLVEFPYSIIKRLFHFSPVMVTTVKRLRVKFMFACFVHNVHALKIINGWRELSIFKENLRRNRRKNA